MSYEAFPTILTCDMKTAPDGRGVEYAPAGKGIGLRWEDSFGPNANPNARGGWSTCYLYAHTAMSIAADAIESQPMTGITGDHPERRQQAASVIREVVTLVKSLAADHAHDGTLTDDRWDNDLKRIIEACQSSMSCGEKSS